MEDFHSKVQFWVLIFWFQVSGFGKSWSEFVGSNTP